MNRSTSPIQRPDAARAALRLPGDLSIWLIILLELATFALMFITYAVVRSNHLEMFNAGQRTLDSTKGVINTWLLIGGSGCVVSGISALSEDRRSRAVAWLVASLVCASGFLVLKTLEYHDKFQAGLDLDTNTFYTFYYLLTGFHFFHVMAAMAFLGILTFQTWRGRYGPHDLHALETGAAFWHMVDLLWIVLFPLLYLLR